MHTYTYANSIFLYIYIYVYVRYEHVRVSEALAFKGTLRGAPVRASLSCCRGPYNLLVWLVGNNGIESLDTAYITYFLFPTNPSKL